MLWGIAAAGFVVGWGACSLANVLSRQSLLEEIRWLKTDKEDLEAELFHRIMVDRRHETLSPTDWEHLNRSNLN